MRTLANFSSSSAVRTAAAVFALLGAISCGRRDQGAPPERSGSPPATDEARPPEVLSFRHRYLEGGREQYAAIALQWEAFVKTHPKDVRALVEWGDALRFSGKWNDAKEKYASAVALDSTDAPAVVAVTAMAVSELEGGADWDAMAKTLEGVVSRDPAFADPYYTLWTVSLARGDEARARECLKQVVALGDMPRPLLHYGRNMLAGAPANAIILTNGDNDTYPPLAWQALTGERSDVSIVNLSLLNLHWYVRFERNHGVPIALDDAAITTLAHTKERTISAQIQAHVFDQLAAKGWPRPLFYSVAVPDPSYPLGAERSLEGLLMRVLPPGGQVGSKQKSDLETMRSLLDTVYWLDSAVDPTVDWEREGSSASLSRNYGAILARVGLALLERGERADAGRYLYRAASLAAFHKFGDTAAWFMTDWEKADPGSPNLAAAKALLGG